MTIAEDRGTIYALALPLSTLLYQFRKFTPTFLQGAARVASGYAWGRPLLTRAVLSVSYICQKRSASGGNPWPIGQAANGAGLPRAQKAKKNLAGVKVLALDSRFSK
jgi:hypothetical protein